MIHAGTYNLIQSKGVKFCVAIVLCFCICLSCVLPIQKAHADLVITPGIIALGAIVGAFGFSLINPAQTGDALNILYERLSFPTQEYLGRLVRTGHFIRLGVEGAESAISEIADVVQELFSNDIPVSGSDVPIYNVSDLVYTDSFLYDFTESNKVDIGLFSERYQIYVNGEWLRPSESPYTSTIEYINSLPLTWNNISQTQGGNSFIIEDNGYILNFGGDGGAVYSLTFGNNYYYVNSNPSNIALGVANSPEGPRLAVIWNTNITDSPFAEYKVYNLHIVSPNIELSFDDSSNTDVIGVFFPPGVIQQDVINRALKDLAQNPDISIPIPETDSIDAVIPISQTQALENFYDIPIEDVETAVPGTNVTPLNPSTYLPPNTLVDIPQFPNLKDFFPFCIPFDYVDLIQLFSSTREAPHFHINWHIPIVNIDWSFDADWSAWDSVASVARSLQLLLYAVFLMLVTARFIKW